MKKSSFSQHYASHIVNLVVLVTGIGMLISAFNIDVGTGPIGAGSEIVPRIMTLAWVILAAIIFVTGLRAERPSSKNPVNLKVTCITIALLFFYVLGLRPIGFVLSSIIFCFLQMLVLAPSDRRAKRHLIIYAAIAIIAPIALNLLFANVFYIILPRGTFITLPF